MRKYLLLESVAIAMLMMSVDCSTTDDYRCESNDLCSSTTDWKYYSCSNNTGHCEKVDPLAIDTLTLPDTTIGQSDYRLELTTGGGIAPYSWLLTRGDEAKLKWLTITPEGENKAILHNSTDSNNVSLYPTETSSGIPLTITLKDSSKHGTAEREDNQGKAFQMTIKINDCPHKCKRINDTVDNPTANENDIECTNDTLYTCKTFYSTCVKWDNGTSCPNNCSNDKITCCSGNLCAGAGEIRCEESTSGGTAQVFNCNRDSSNCLVWDTSGINPCSKNICNGKMCGDCPTMPICTLESKDCVDTKTKKLCGPDQNGCPIWISIPCDGNRTCQNGDCKYVVGSIGPGDGIVFYDNPNYASDGWQYLEAAKQDQGDAAWGCSGTVISGASYTDIGTGKSNTKAILDNCSELGIAARLCWGQNLGNGYTDWFLPSLEELNLMYQMRNTIGGFLNTYLYWSSSSYVTDSGAWGVGFEKDVVGTGHRVAVDHVRCVRAGP